MSLSSAAWTISARLCSNSAGSPAPRRWRAAAAAGYRSELAQLRSQYAARPRLKVFFQVWDRPLYTLSGGHVVSEVLSLCGGDNVFADLTTLAPAIDKEAVLARDPDVILIGATGAEGARQTADWNRFGDLRAVRLHHVFTVDPSLIGRMSPRILQGVREVCGLLDSARANPDVQRRVTAGPQGRAVRELPTGAPGASPIKDSGPMTFFGVSV